MHFGSENSDDSDANNVSRSGKEDKNYIRFVVICTSFFSLHMKDVKL